MFNKKWTEEEIAILEDNWGKISIPSIAKKLGRTLNSIKVKAVKLGLQRHIHQGEYITFHQLLVAIGQKQNYSYYLHKFEKYDFPYKFKKSVDKSFRVVYIDDFWEWSEKNQCQIDFSKFEKNMLGPEPSWVDVKRRNDISNKKSFKTTPWTRKEDKRLEELLSKYKYNYYELSKLLKRTEGAIQRRICDLGIQYRPLKADNHIKWTKEEYKVLGDLIKERYDYNMISDIIGKSAKAIRGRVYDMYLTESLDKVIALMNNGDWGNGRPQLSITHKKLNGPEKKQVKSDLTKFAGILKGIMKSKYDDNDFWQSELCMNFSEKCLVEQTCCDECINFIRIKPQYCNRCGITVMSRTKIDICEKCRAARKKSYQRKFMALKDKVSIKG